ncbi:MAG TPA: EfeM/EfeO family lipoprotein [Streptosporangiales bacterium]
MLTRRRVVLGSAVLALVVALLAVGAYAGGLWGGDDAARAGSRVDVSARTCASGWTPGPAGRQRYDVRNTGTSPLRVTVVDAETGGIYGQLYLLAAGTTQRFEFTLPRGSYRWRCVPIRGVASVSAVRRVTGTGGEDARPLRPVSSGEITAAVDVYRAAVSHGLRSLVRDTHALAVAVDRGDLAQARARWLTAHLDYERLGAAYGTFGDLDGAINGRPDGLPRRQQDPHFTGFLRLEYGLWHGQSAATLRPVARALDASVRKLAARFPKLPTNPGDLPLRAHEILENTLQFELTGDTDQGSHTNLATAAANVDGTAMVLKALTPALRVRDARLLSRLQADVRGLSDLLAAEHHGSSWTPLDRLGATDRQRLNAAVGSALEDLALVPGILQMPPAIVPP